ncbi:unnamed protein product [Pedinophyceae sp. YPF-701]|nr:unnamed protein product [Pedinophyceae sp. YPF-701]
MKGEAPGRAGRSISFAAPEPERTRWQKCKDWGKAVLKVDAYAVDVVRPAWHSTLVTFLVWAFMIAYIILLAISLARTPAIKTVGQEWTIGTGPFPVKVTCKATQGCLISNVISSGFTIGVSEAVSPTERSCVEIGFNEQTTVNVVFSINPQEGPSVVWRDGDGDAGLPGAGITLESEIRCPPERDDGSCVDLLNIPIKPGTMLLQHVETKNHTASGAAAFRREWFSFSISDIAAIEQGTTNCEVPNNGVGWVQARLRINSMYNLVEVDRRIQWLDSLGAIGGAYELGLKVGLLILLALSYSKRSAVTTRNIARSVTLARSSRAASRANSRGTSGAQTPKGFSDVVKRERDYHATDDAIYPASGKGSSPRDSPARPERAHNSHTSEEALPV